jgi:hypothetical protein
MRSFMTQNFSVFEDEVTGKWKRLHNEELHGAELLTT